MVKKKSDILSSDQNHLAIMYNHDGITIDTNLLKYSAIKKEVEEFRKSKLPNAVKLEETPVNMDPETETVINAFTEKKEIQKLVSEDIYKTIKDGDVRKVNIFINEYIMKDILSTYNEYGVSTPFNNLTFINNEIGSSGEKAESNEKAPKRGLLQKLSDLFKFKSKEAEETYAFDVLEFFSKIKGLTKENIKLYVDRLSGYIVALKNCETSGQQALKEKLLRDMIVNKYESILYAKGLYYVVTEDQVVDFVKKTEKGVRLTYVKNYMRVIPPEVIQKINDANNLEIFDNYVILHYDPEYMAFSETVQETKKRRDPILFGVISGSNKLYYITDWIDDYCDLTLDKFVETLQINKDDLKMKDTIL